MGISQSRPHNSPDVEMGACTTHGEAEQFSSKEIRKAKSICGSRRNAGIFKTVILPLGAGLLLLGAAGSLPIRRRLCASHHNAKNGDGDSPSDGSPPPNGDSPSDGSPPPNGDSPSDGSPPPNVDAGNSSANTDGDADNSSASPTRTKSTQDLENIWSEAHKRIHNAWVVETQMEEDDDDEFLELLNLELDASGTWDSIKTKHIKGSAGAPLLTEEEIVFGTYKALWKRRCDLGLTSNEKPTMGMFKDQMRMLRDDYQRRAQKPLSERPKLMKTAHSLKKKERMNEAMNERQAARARIFTSFLDGHAKRQEQNEKSWRNILATKDLFLD